MAHGPAARTGQEHAPARAQPEQDRLLRLFDLDPAKGELRWRARAPADKPAGTRATQGHLVVRVDGRLLAVHRVIWTMVHGAPPAGIIQHANGDKTDNRIENLVALSRAELNARRALAHKPERARLAPAAQRASQRITGARTGWLGVTPYEGGRYRARILYNGTPMSLGVFPDRQAADSAYAWALRRLQAEQHTPGLERPLPQPGAGSPSTTGSGNRMAR